MIADLVSGGPAAVGIPGGAEKVLDIQQSIVGKIIGKGGETIKGMQSTTGARIQIDQTAWKVTITGAQQAAVDAAAGMIETIANGGDPPQFGAATAAAATGGSMGGYGQGQMYAGYGQPQPYGYGGGHYGGYAGYQSQGYGGGYQQQQQPVHGGDCGGGYGAAHQQGECHAPWGAFASRISPYRLAWQVFSPSSKFQQCRRRDWWGLSSGRRFMTPSNDLTIITQRRRQASGKSHKFSDVPE
jgi:hypothetical protein